MSNLLKDASILLTPTGYDNGSMNAIKPTNGDGDFTFVRGSAATRVNAQGLVENVQIIGGELVTNGDFSEQGSQLITNGDFSNGATGWELIGAANVANGVGNFVGSGDKILQRPNLTQGKFYKITFDILNYTSGTSRVYLGSTGDASFTATANGTYSAILEAESSTDVVQWRSDGGSTFIGSIDNCSVVEVGQNWAIENTWTIGDGVANGNGANGTSEELSQSGVVTTGKTYSISYEIKNYVSGLIRLRKPLTIFRNANGTYTETVTATASSFIFTPSNFNGSITNISVKEVTDDTNLPRINYEGFSYDGNGDIIPNSGCGSWLLEPQSTNLFVLSNGLTSSGFWPRNSSLIATVNATISPDGTLNATRFVNAGGGNRLGQEVALTSGLTYAFSFYMKNNGGNASLATAFDGQSASQSYTITNDWVRYEFTFTATSTETSQIRLFNGESDIDLFVFGTQLENQSFATSYIPTEGATNTRNQDIATDSGNATLINSIEGTLYAEMSALVKENGQKILSISDGTSSNTVKLGIAGNNAGLKFFADIRVGGVTQAFLNENFGDVAPTFKKCAIKYKENDFALWVDGVEVATDTSGSTFSANTLNVLKFTRGDAGQKFFGKNKALAVYKEALTDAELQCLTTP